MSNNKQSSVENFWEQMEEKAYVSQETEDVKKITIMIDVNDYMELKKQAKAMHKEEIINAHTIGYVIGGGNGYIHEPEQYYNETYGGNK